MSILKSRRQNTVLVGTTSFRYPSDAMAYFSGKYGFVGEQLQKLCAETGLLRVAAEVDTGEWFKETYEYRVGRVYKKHDRIKIAATSKKWEVIVGD
nr:MAG TPA: hypothetical protein [Caudoviricetes sp.]